MQPHDPIRWNRHPETKLPSLTQLNGRSKTLSIETRAPRRPMMLLAPKCASSLETGVFTRVAECDSRYELLLTELQRLRGRVYLADGAITEDQLTADGRFVQPIDEQSWHLAIFDEHGELAGCTRFRPHAERVRFRDLGVAESALAKSDVWGYKLQSAVQTEIERANRLGIVYVELGGWALAESIRFTSEAMRMVLYQYGMAQVLGGALGITTATTRHHSSSILRRIGGQPLTADGVTLPPYFDPHYGCEMEVLRFDSEEYNPKYASWVDECRAQLADTMVLRMSSTQIFRHSLQSLKKAIEPQFGTVGDYLREAS